MKKIKLTQVAIPQNNSVKAFQGERIYIATGDVAGNEVIFRTAEKVDFQNKPSRANQEVKPSEVIFAKMMSTDKALVIDSENSKHIYSSGFFVLKPTDVLLPEYLYYFLRSKSFHSQKDKHCSGATQKAVTLGGLENIFIPLPSLEEQKEIVKKLDAITELINLKKLAIEKTEELTKSVFLEMFGDPFANPKGWNCSIIEKVCIRIVDCPHSTPVFVDYGKYCMDTTCIKPGYIDFNKIRYVSTDTFNKRNIRMIPEVGDILFSREGALLGIATIIPEGIELCLGQRIMLFRLNNDLIHSKYFEFVLNSDSFKLSYKGKIGGSASPHLNISDIRKLTILIPTKPLQDEFANIAKTNEHIINSHKLSLQSLQSLYDSTAQSIFG